MKSLLRYGLTVLTAVLLSISAVQVASAQCSIYTFNPISGQLDCVTATGVNVITFATDGNERIRITQGGNVLVGTTTDDGVNLFQVDGSGAFATSVVTPLVTNAGTLGLSATGANVITFSTNGSERGRWSSGGNLLIGTTTDDGASKLQVAGIVYSDIGASGGGVNLYLNASSAAVSGIRFGNNVNTGGFIDYNGATLRFITDSVSRFTISGGTATLYDQTAVTGSTSLVVRAGAGQSTNALQSWRNSSNTELSTIGSNGGFNFFGSSYAIYASYGSVVTRLLHSSTVSRFGTENDTPLSLTANDTERIRINSTGIGFFGVTPVARAAALTAADANTINTGDATSDTVIGNIRTRLGEMEQKLKDYGLLQ